MNVIELAKKDVPKMLLAAFPEYRGRRFRIYEATSYYPQNYWDGGSRNYFKLCNLQTGEMNAPLPEVANPFQKIAHSSFEIPAGYCVVEYSIFCGKDLGISFYVPAANLSKLLPSPQTEELTDHEKIVLVFTKELVSSYNGVSDFRYVRAHARYKISKSEWVTACESLKQKGLLTKKNSLTVDGKNTASSITEFRTY